MRKIRKIVLTGGPCGGKTSSLEYIKEKISGNGYNVLIVSEVAEELSKKGYTLEFLGREKYQEAILKWQLEKEKISEEKAKEMTNDTIILLDRGVIDCLVYTPKDMIKKIMDHANISTNDLYNRYDAVFHLISIAKDKPEEYNKTVNGARQECTPEEAAKFDDITLNMWKKFYNVVVIDNSTDFERKKERTTKAIIDYLNNTRRYDIER